MSNSILRIEQGITRIALSFPENVGFRRSVITENGIEYATALLDAGEACILVGTVPEWAMDAWLPLVGEAAQGKNITHWITFDAAQTADAIDALRKLYPQICLVADKGTIYAAGMEYSGAAAPDPSSSCIEIRGSRSLQIGTRTLHFIAVTTAAGHWMACMDEMSASVFCGEMFSSYSAGDTAITEQMRPDEIQKWKKGVLLACEDISGQEPEKAIGSAPAILRKWELRRLCPAMGPVVSAKDTKQVWDIYDAAVEREILQNGSARQKKRIRNITLVYADGMCMRRMAEAIREGLETCLESFAAGSQSAEKIKIHTLSLGNVSRNDALRFFKAADVLILGSGDGRDQVARSITDLLADLDLADRKVFFYSMSPGSAPGSDVIRKKLQGAGALVPDNGCILTAYPAEKEMQQVWDYGFNCGCTILGIANPRAPKLVKCLVCGEIFDAALGICPVCGVGLDQCVPVTEEEITFRTATDRQYLILGGGTAAVSAADSIRLRDKTGKITMVMKESYLPINRPMLTKDLDASQAPEGICLHPHAWYEERGITLITGVAAQSINPDKKTVTFSDGSCRTYDKLVYAVGSEAFLPPFKGADKKGVFTIRHVDDISEMAPFFDTAHRCVVIGGGVLGLEAAYEILRRGIAVTVLEATPQIIGRSVHETTAAHVMEIMAGMQVPAVTGVSIDGMEGDESVTGVRLQDGTVYPADLVIVSCGSRANVQLARDAGAAVNRAVVVDGHMQTSVPDMYACGDCAELMGINYQLWSEASEQGRTAGANAAGENMLYVNVPAALSMDAFGISLFSLGDKI